jgi:serine O-acetyltransferase
MKSENGMIQSRKDLKEYLEQDKVALWSKGKKRPSLFGDDVWKFQILMRKTEYHLNCSRTPFGRMIGLCYKARFLRRSVRLGFGIPLNVFGPGLAIAHYGALVVNSKAKIGKNCRIHAMVVIGATDGSPNAPVIGDNVYIGSGAKIIGDIHIADNVAIGANAVVVKSIDEPGTTWAGVPARKISDKDSSRNLCPDIFKNEETDI